MTPIYDTVSVESVIARCKLQLRLIDSSHDNYLEMLIMESLDHLSAYSQLVKKQCVISVTDKTAKLPGGLVRFLGLRLCCDETPQTNDPITDSLLKNQNLFFYADTKFLNQCDIDSAGFNNFADVFQINNGFIHFNQDLGITEAVIAYLALNTDDDGNSLIYQRYERALTNYACYMFTLAYSENYNQYIIEKYNQTWVEQKHFLRGQDNMNDFLNNKREIGNLMTALKVSKTVLW